MKKAVLAIGALCVLAFAGPHPKYFPAGLTDTQEDTSYGVETDDAAVQELEPAQIDNDADLSDTDADFAE
jgi:hypothetical protein